MKAPKDSLVLIDGHALLYRAFHALPPLKTKSGLPTNAVYGFVTTLFKAFEELKPKYCAVAFDVAGPTFRHKTYPAYKASRPETPPDLLAQVPHAYKLTEALNIPIFTKEGFEADDVIGTLATQAKAKNTPVIIVTSDRDSYQLVDDSTFVYIIRRGIIDTLLVDAAAVKERLGLAPEQMADFKALAGDASDEIPGVAGIGEKTAVSLLQKWSSLAALYRALKAGKAIHGISERIRQKLIQGEAAANQSLALATIERNVPLVLNLTACAIHDYDEAKAAAVLQELEFFSLVKRLPSLGAKPAKASNKRDWQFEILTTKLAITKAVATLTTSPTVVVDTETDTLGGSIIGISLAANGRTGRYIPLIKEHGAALPPAKIASLLAPLLANPAVGKVGHNIKYDLHALSQLGLTVAPISFDTMIAAYVLHADRRAFDLDTVSLRELGYTMISFSDVAVGKGKAASLVGADPRRVAEYAAEDGVITFRLFDHLTKQLAKQPRLNEVAEKIDFPLIPVLVAMEERGVCLDRQVLRQLEDELAKEISQVRAAIEQYTQAPINLNSPQQLQDLLFRQLGLGKTGLRAVQKGVSTAAGELEKLQGLHPVIDSILRHRELTKLQTTYVQALPRLVGQDGRLHTQFSQTTAATGRLSSLDPNLQNIPIRTPLGKTIRQAFVAPGGYQFLSLDYSQIELRVAADMAGDENLRQAFLDGRDIHDEVAKQLGVDRRAAKAINFGLLYGLSPYGLAQGLKIDQKTAKAYIDDYFATYPQLAAWIASLRETVRIQGYVETLFGRRRAVPEIDSPNAVIRASAERMALNAPIQGTAADIMKLAMIAVEGWLEETFGDNPDRPYLILQVHDELLLEVPRDLVGAVAKKIKALMEGIDKLSLPLEVALASGDNWGELSNLAV